MPSSEAEAALLGALLVDGALAHEVLDAVSPRDFASLVNEQIYDAICDLAGSGAPVDLVTVAAELRARGSLQRVGGASYLSSLVDQTPDVAHAGHYANLIRASALRRELGELSALARELAESAKTGSGLEADLARIHAALADILTRAAGRRDGAKTAPELAAAVVEQVRRTRAGQGIETVLHTGLEELDEVLAGLRAGCVYVVGGRPGTGKTALGTQVAEHAAASGTVLVFSLEMSGEQLVQRFLAARTGVPIPAIVRGALTPAQVVSLDEAARAVPPGLLVDDTSGLSILDIRARCRRFLLQSRPALVVVDYLGLVRPLGRGRTREQEVAEVSRGCKELAKELGAPVLVLSQLTRTPDRENRRPALWDLRESGAIEQDADAVLLLHRPRTDEPEAELLVAKNRHGPGGRTIRLRFDGRTTRFCAASPAGQASH